MRKEYWYILLTYILIMLPSYRFLNKYTVALLPLLCMLLTVYFLRREITEAEFDRVLKLKQTHSWSFTAFKYALIAQAALNLIFNPGLESVTGPIMHYSVMPVYAVLVAPVFEETIFRKIIFGELAKRMHFGWAAVISSLLFASIHFNIAGFVSYFATGAIFCYVYRKSGSIVPTMLAHGYLNFVVVLVNTLKT